MKYHLLELQSLPVSAGKLMSRMHSGAEALPVGDAS